MIASLFFTLSGLACGFHMLILGIDGRRFANEPGSTSLTKVTHFTFLQKLGNPCGVTQALRADSRRFRSSASLVTASPISPTEFYQAMVTAILLAMQKLQELETSDQNLPYCNGLYLKSLPLTPSFANMSVKELYREVYQSGIYIAAHLHIMSLDRQMLSRGSTLNDDQVIEDPNQFDTIMTLRCGNESDSLITIVRELTTKIEDILCTLISGSTIEERASYRQPYNSLLQTTIYRYHSSCSLLQTRDCLLVKETKAVLNNMAAKFNRLRIGTDVSQIEFDSDMLEFDNSLQN